MLFHYTDDITSLDLTRKQQLSYEKHARHILGGEGVGRAVNPSDSYKLITSDPNAPFMNSFCGNTWEFRNTDAESQRITRRDKKAFLSDQGKETEEKTERERLEISSSKLKIPREQFMQRWAQ